MTMLFTGFYRIKGERPSGVELEPSKPLTQNLANAELIALTQLFPENTYWIERVYE